MLTGAATHDVANQPPPLAPYNAFEDDLACARRSMRGRRLGSRTQRDTGELAARRGARALQREERTSPSCAPRRYATARRVDLDPSAWLLRQAIERELHSLPWRDPRAGAHVVRAGAFYVWSQVNAGVMCPCR